MQQFRRSVSILIGFAALLFGLLAAESARAATYTLCIEIPVTLIDQTGAPGEVGTSTAPENIGKRGWRARGIVIDHVDDAVGNGVPGYEYGLSTNQDTGCFDLIANHAGFSVYTVWIETRGSLADDNRLETHNGSGPSLYGLKIVLPEQGGTFVLALPNERILPRLYAILAYTIHVGFRGRYNDEQLHVKWYPDSATTSACGENCTGCASKVNGDLSRICIKDSNDQRKFHLVHEYGHANLRHAVNVGGIDCTYAATGDPTGKKHKMRSLEKTSCAFHEGWADFVAADVWNGFAHDNGDPGGLFSRVYYDIDVEAGHGSCMQSGAHDTDFVSFPMRYADTCWESDAHCTGGDCDGRATELDWMRTLWDFHTDGDLPGIRPNHAEVHTAIEAAGGWNSENLWDRLIGGLSGSERARLQQAADWNGTSEP